jgi:endonuclease G
MFGALMGCLVVPFAVLVGSSCPAEAGIPFKRREIHSRHLPYGLPKNTPHENDLIFRSCYVLSSNDKTKFADWVAYRLTRFEVSGKVDLDRRWRADPLLDDDETLEPSPDDYKGASKAHDYQRGHLCPLASVKGTPYASEVNYFSNIVPQRGPMNRGPWGKLEDVVRELVIRHETVWVMTGPLYEREMPKLPGADEPHRVPSGFWKIILTGGNLAGPAVACFIVDQDAGGRDPYLDCRVKLAEVERRSRLDLLPFEPDEALARQWVETW